MVDGQIYAVVADYPLALAYAGENPDKIKKVGDNFTHEVYGTAICKRKPDLLVKINSGLKALQEEGVIERLVEKWLSSQQMIEIIFVQLPICTAAEIGNVKPFEGLLEELPKPSPNSGKLGYVSRAELMPRIDPW